MKVFERDDTEHGVQYVLKAEADAAVAAERQRCADEVPTNWLDPLLSGPKSLVRATDDCRLVESLLRAVRSRILGA